MAIELLREKNYAKYPNHIHTCLVYNTLQEWQSKVIPFLITGLGKQEKCLYISGSENLQNLHTNLKQQGVDSHAFCESGQLIVFPTNPVFLYENEFDPYQATLFLIEEARQALREGYTTLRFSCEMSAVLPYTLDPELLIKYETLLNKFVFNKYNCTALCQYEASKFPPKFLDIIQASHTDTIQQRQSAC